MIHVSTLPVDKLKEVAKILERIAETTRNNVVSLREASNKGQTETAEEIAFQALTKLKAGLWGLHRILFNKPPNIKLLKGINTHDWEAVVLILEETAKRIDEIANEIHYHLEKGWLDFATQSVLTGFYSLKGNALKLHNLLLGEELPDIFLS